MGELLFKNINIYLIFIKNKFSINKVIMMETGMA